MEVRLRRGVGRVDALGSREENWSSAGGRGQLLKAQGTLKKALLLAKWFSEVWRYLCLTIHNGSLTGSMLDGMELELLYSHPRTSFAYLKMGRKHMVVLQLSGIFAANISDA